MYCATCKRVQRTNTVQHTNPAHSYFPAKKSRCKSKPHLIDINKHGTSRALRKKQPTAAQDQCFSDFLKKSKKKSTGGGSRKRILLLPRSHGRSQIESRCSYRPSTPTTTRVVVTGTAGFPGVARSLGWDNNIITLGGPSSIELFFVFPSSNDKTQGEFLT